MPLARPKRTIGVMDGMVRGGALPRNKQPAAMVEFARRVAESLDGPILRYSKRLALLRLSDRLGIGRFQANLIIAAVQHRAENPEQQPPARRSLWIPGVALAILAEGVILVGAWRVLCG